MAVEVEIRKKEERVLIVVLKGELDTDAAFDFEKQVASRIGDKVRMVVFDLKDLTYVASMGLGIMFRIKVRMKERGGKITIINPQPQIEAVFETVKFMPDHMFASLEEADKCLDAYLESLQDKGSVSQDRDN